MKRIIALVVFFVILLSCLSSCVLGKKNGKDSVDLSKIIVVKTENFEIDGAMYAFLLYDYVNQYSYYLSYYGYDTSLPLSKQTGECAFDEEKTWFEYFCDMVNHDIEQFLPAAEAAYEAGYVLSDQDNAEIDAYIEELSQNALDSGYASLDEMIEVYYLEGITAKTFEKCMKLQQYAYNYMNEYASSLEYTEEELLAYRESHPDEFIMIDYIEYTFYATYENDATEDEKATAYQEAKRKAEEFLSENVGIEAFKNAIVAMENEGLENPYDPDDILSDYTVEDEYYSTTGAEAEETKEYYEWAYSPERNVADTYMHEYIDSDGEKYYTVYCITAAAHIDDYFTKNCRHILFYVDYEIEDEEELNSAIADASAKANAVLDEYNKSEKTEQVFIDLEKRCTEDESAFEATIYENVEIGYMVPEFENWIYDKSRVSGDVDIVQTDYGYHVVYFIGDGEIFWKLVAKSSLADNSINEYFETLLNKYPTEYNQDSLAMIP